MRLVEILLIILGLAAGYAAVSRVEQIPPAAAGPTVSIVLSTATSVPLMIVTPTPPTAAVTPLSQPATSATASPPPSPVDTPVPTATATVTTVVYFVQSGDTIEAIANKFGVSQNAILQVNQLSDPNQLALGQRLLIPSK